MVEFEELGLEEGIEFEGVTTIEEMKENLKKGYGIVISGDKCKGIYYSEDHAKLYLFECQDEEEDLTTVENYELMGMEISIEEVDKLITEYLNTLKKEEGRRKKYDEWLSE
ncbi:hypothetical protein PM10SUCC1_19250 [Propionigenium maris DSM 9537]|uniref:Uncharacterized protein n=1 Tax=Propionigenium maris DSM 9537 TaxID=1123000 RepID=A0A9W6GM97_9FUSO|nr:hypothetical protein [Propionigenium maris]GLI56411.1 hypothetical protein PM10SUCC1_19250 [Propionigenium maris DSM 9537]